MAGKILQFFFLFSTVIGCSTQHLRRESGIMHKSSEASARFVSKLNWKDVPEDLFMKQNTEGEEIVPKDNPMVIFVNKWVQKIHFTLLAKYPETFKDIPVPKVIVVKGYTQNAKMKISGRFFNIPVIIEGMEKDAPVIDSYLEIDGNTLSLNNPTDSPLEMYNDLEGRFDLVVEFFNQNLKGCSAKIENNTFVISKGCKQLKDFSGKSYKGLTIYAAENTIIVTTGLLEFVENEENLVAIFSHELAHYYRAGANHQSDYGYFYSIHDTKWIQNPVPSTDPELLELGEKLKGAFDELKNYNSRIISGDTAYITPSKIEARFLKASRYKREDVEKFINLTKDIPQCHELLKYNKASHRTQSPHTAPEDPLLDQGLEEFIKRVDADPSFHERIRNNCFSAFEVKRSNPLTEFIWFTLVEMLISRAGQMPDIPSDFESLNELIKYANTKIQAKELSFRNTINRAVELGLAQYTSDEEADKLATEILAELKINPQSWVDTLFAFLKESMRESSQFFYPDPLAPRCVEAEQNDWKIVEDGKATPFEPSLGTLRDPHHSFCYRIFLVSQEIKAHKYEGPWLTLNPIEWQKTKQALAKPF